MEKVIEDFFGEEGRTAYPTLSIFVRKYLKPMDGNDRKALSVFSYYETKETLRRLEAELFSVRRLEASRLFLQNLIGDTKAKQFQGYDKWAGILLQMLPALKNG